MVLGAIVDAGVPLADLEREVRKIGVGGFSLTARRTRRGGVTGTLVSVDLDEDSPRGLGWTRLRGDD